MRMLRRMCGVIKKDMILNDHLRGTTIVVQASKKLTEKRLKCDEDERGSFVDVDVERGKEASQT